ncbi:MAG: hypothetical protein JO307_20535, partial [Bryobacterales bacterium]|nr:hypothetical protein [Bryobacterales bacterium]
MATAVDNLGSPNGAVAGARNTSHEALAEIWAEVLRRPDLENNANFFDVGGDSLKAMEVITRVREVLQVDLPLIAFFEDPTLAHLTSVIEELRAEAASPSIVRDAGRSEFPLSYSQQMFWLLEQQNPGTGIYNTARIFRLRGRVDSAVLESSLNELRRRHVILRVRFVHRENGLIQVVDAPAPLPLPLLDLSGLDPEAREKTGLKLAHEAVAEPFNLASGPLLRARLVRLDPENHLLCMAIHHAVSDGFSGSILLNELGAIYDAFAKGEPSPLSEPDLHFTDYAAWEQEWMSGSMLEQEMQYWRSMLQDAHTSLDLPADRARSFESGHRGRKASVTISAESLDNLQGLAQSNGATLFTTLSAGLRVLLYRWSGQSDFLLGTMASNRSHKSAERMIGCFVNPIALRNRVTGIQSAKDLLNNEKNVVMDAFAHQDCPFVKIVEAVNPERPRVQRTSNDSPLFNVALLLQNFPDISLRGAWFEARQIDFDAQVALLDLRFIASEISAGLRLDCEYNADLFDDRTIERLLEDYVSVLMQMTAAPETRVEDIAISEDLLKLRDEYRRRQQEQTIAIAATFTAGPIEEPLAFWMEKLQIPSRIAFAPYNQVFQQLLDPASLLASNKGVNVILARLEDWRNPAGVGEHRINELVSALKLAASRGGAPYVVAVFPPLNSATAQAESYAQMEAVLASELGETAGVHLITSADVLGLYPVDGPEDAYALKLGDIPYTAAFFTAIATVLARRIYNLFSTPLKVVALGCDQTLWKGLCGKDGPLGVEVDASHRALQQFMIAQFEAGRILCLCGENQEDHVAAVFESNPGMLLTRDHVFASRINGSSRAENLKELSEDLQIGLESFIFIDGNPRESAEVRACCPEITVIDLPAGQGVAEHLRHCWAFDRSENVTGSPGSRLQARDSDLLNQIASELCSIEKITYAIESQKSSRSAKSNGDGRLRNSTEDLIAAIWTGLLGVAPDVDDNFFQLGGNSLRAAQVIARVRQALGVEIPLRTLFESPTVAGFAVHVEAAVRELAGLTAPPLVPLPRAGHPPVSFLQRRLWFIEELEPGNPLYNISQAYRIRGNLDVAALEQSINEVVNRHEALRTSFEAIDGNPLQVIAPTLKIALPITDLPLRPTEQEMVRIAREEALRPFDLKTGPLFRARLLRVSSEEHVLLLTIHHIVSDGWSLGVLAKELRALYGAFSGDNPVELPRLPVQYADFSMWQRDWLRGEILEKHAAYWRQQLSGAPALIELPSDRPRALQPTHKGAILTTLVPRALVESLTAFSHSEGATLFMTLLAAFQTLLFRHSGQEDIVVGSPVAGRSCAEIEPLIGFFVNTLALRTNVSGDPTFRELLKLVKEVTLNAYAHQDIPFERLVEELKVERSLSYNPIFQVVFALQNAPSQALALPGLTLERIPMHPGTALFDLSWFAFPVADGLQIRVEYSTELFDESTIARALGHFQELLQGIAGTSGLRLSELPMLTAAERHQLVVQMNDTATPYAAETCVPSLFERRSAAAPEQLAVAFNDQRI